MPGGEGHAKVVMDREEIRRRPCSCGKGFVVRYLVLVENYYKNDYEETEIHCVDCRRADAKRHRARELAEARRDRANRRILESRPGRVIIECLLQRLREEPSRASAMRLLQRVNLTASKLAVDRVRTSREPLRPDADVAAMLGIHSAEQLPALAAKVGGDARSLDERLARIKATRL